MKKSSFFPIFLLAAVVALFASCERYDTASIAIEQISYNDTTRIVHYTAYVTDDGGCPRCIEAGYCYSYFDVEPSHTCYYTTVVPMIRDSMMTKDSSGYFLKFNWTCQLPYIENAGNADTTGGMAYDSTIYYFRSYIITNAGTSYSDSVSTVIVHSSY